MARFGKNITIEKIYDDKVTATEKFREDSISIKDKAELVKELLDCSDIVINSKTKVTIELEPAVNESYLLRMVKTTKIR